MILNWLDNRCFEYIKLLIQFHSRTQSITPWDHLKCKRTRANWIWQNFEIFQFSFTFFFHKMNSTNFFFSVRKCFETCFPSWISCMEVSLCRLWRKHSVVLGIFYFQNVNTKGSNIIRSLYLFFWCLNRAMKFAKREIFNRRKNYVQQATLLRTFRFQLKFVLGWYLLNDKNDDRQNQALRDFGFSSQNY